MPPSVAPADIHEIEADARLDPSIQFTNPISPYATAPRAAFLTGATGFLGVYILEEMLRKTQADVYCLVRASSDQNGYERLQKQLETYGLWDPAFAPRLRPVVGDVAQPRFGLTVGEFDELGASVDVVYHSAGWLNMAYPYARMKPANVIGTQEVLRLSGTVSTKPLQVLSSMVVFFSDAHLGDRVVSETSAPLYHPTLKGGYSKSKWVADRLVAAAQERGLPACIYRPVRIMGHSQTGAIQDMSDILPMLLKACVLMGKYPTFDIKVTMVPVDFVSRAMIHFAAHQEFWGKSFHFFHPDPIEWGKLMALFGELGYPMEELPYDQWWRELKRQMQDTQEPTERRAFLSTTLLGLTAPHFLFFKRPTLDASNTHQGLEGTGIAYPPIDRKLMATYINYWKNVGYLP